MNRFVFDGKQQVRLEPFTLEDLKPGEVRVKTHYSLMSTGTENIVFNRLFEPGSHWDKWVKYPFYPGYAAVGEVEKIGPEVKTLKVGDRVAIRASHRSHHNVGEGAASLIPQGMPLPEAVWFAFAKIAFMGAKAAEFVIGDTCLLIGAGPIGQMAIRWARALGLQRIQVADVVAYRLGLAKKGGATSVIETPIAEDTKIEEARVVIDCTGNAKVFSTALRLVKNRGRVVILGDTGAPSTQHLTSDVITRGLSIVGAHDVHETPEWNGRTIVDYFFNLASTGRFDLSGLTSHTFAPADCEKAYATANTARETTMGLLFDWSK